MSNHNLKLNLIVNIYYEKGKVQSITFDHTFSQGFDWEFHSSHHDAKIEGCLERWLNDYQKGLKPSVEVPLALDKLPPFTQTTLLAVKEIPWGSVLSYGQVAAQINKPTAARAVGGACGRNPFPLIIPCHRVLDARLKIGGYSAGCLSIKESLLRFEGITNL